MTEADPSRALKASNDVVKLAERVAAEPGLGLEMAAVKSPDRDAMLLAPHRIKRMRQPIAPGTNDAFGRHLRR